MSFFTHAKAIPTVASALSFATKAVEELKAAAAHHADEAVKHNINITATEQKAAQLVQNVRDAAERRIAQVEVLRAEAVAKAEELKAAAEAEVKAAEAAITRVSAFFGL